MMLPKAMTISFKTMMMFRMMLLIKRVKMLKWRKFWPRKPRVSNELINCGGLGSGLDKVFCV